MKRTSEHTFFHKAGLAQAQTGKHKDVDQAWAEYASSKGAPTPSSNQEKAAQQREAFKRGFIGHK